MQVNHLSKRDNLFGFTHQKRSRVYQRNYCVIGLVRIEFSENHLRFLIICVLKITRRLLSPFTLVERNLISIEDDWSKPYLDESDIPEDSLEVCESFIHDNVTNVNAENDTHSLLHSEEDHDNFNQQVDLGALSDEISSSELCANTPDTLNELVLCYNSTLSSALDRHAPLITKTIPARPLVPWFNDEIKEARRLRRRAERRWRRSGLDTDLLTYKAIKNKTNNLMNEARRVFFTEFVEENCNDQRKLFLVTKRLLGERT